MKVAKKVIILGFGSKVISLKCLYLWIASRVFTVGKEVT